MTPRHFNLGLPAVALLAMLAAGCASDDQIRDTITDVNREFQGAYERVLAEKGSRTYRVAPKVAFAAMAVVLQRVGMHIDDQVPELGYLNVSAAAPAPLNSREWRRAASADLPKLRRARAAEIGLPAARIPAANRRAHGFGQDLGRAQ